MTRRPFTRARGNRETSGDSSPDNPQCALALRHTAADGSLLERLIADEDFAVDVPLVTRSPRKTFEVSPQVQSRVRPSAARDPKPRPRHAAADRVALVVNGEGAMTIAAVTFLAAWIAASLVATPALSRRRHRQ